MVAITLPWSFAPGSHGLPTPPPQIDSQVPATGFAGGVLLLIIVSVPRPIDSWTGLDWRDIGVA